jgi:protein AF-17/10
MKDSKVVLSIDKNVKDTKNNLNSKYKNDKKTMTTNEELIGGCCVCSDDQGFSNNALVYCDGKDCTVACHTGKIKN